MCVTCPEGTTSTGEHDASGADTTCDATSCGENEKVENHVCVACPAGKTSTGSHDASGEDSTCEEAESPPAETEAGAESPSAETEGAGEGAGGDDAGAASSPASSSDCSLVLTQDAKVGDTEELPEDFVVAELEEKTKAHKNHAVLDAHPELKAALTVQPASNRPSLQEFLGWRHIITHRKQELTKAAFEEALGIPEKRAKAVEKKAIAEIKAARRAAGEEHVEFHGGSWH